MAIGRPDKYEHNNPNLPIVDAVNVAGGFKDVASLEARNGIPIAKRTRLIEVVGIGLFRYTGSDFKNDNWVNVANWLDIVPVTGPRGETGKTGADGETGATGADGTSGNSSISVSDEFYIDSDGVLQTNVSHYKQRVTWLGGSQIIPLVFKPLTYPEITVQGLPIDDEVDFIYENENPMQVTILGTLHLEDRIKLKYKYFINEPE